MHEYSEHNVVHSLTMLSHWRIHLLTLQFWFPVSVSLSCHLSLIIKTWTGYNIWLLLLMSLRVIIQTKELLRQINPDPFVWAPDLAGNSEAANPRTYFQQFSSVSCSGGATPKCPSVARLFPPAPVTPESGSGWCDTQGTGLRSSQSSQSVDVTGGEKTWRRAL